MGDFSLAGIGAVVLKDVSENSVVVGNPARRIRAAR
jgi:acetyltransferase-like isoleucine patch superfamily enzyme